MGYLRISEALDYKVADFGEINNSPSEPLDQFGPTIAQTAIRYAC